eukprot:438963-Rhodomonas_salina.1
MIATSSLPISADGPVSGEAMLWPEILATSALQALCGVANSKKKSAPIGMRRAFSSHVCICTKCSESIPACIHPSDSLPSASASSTPKMVASACDMTFCMEASVRGAACSADVDMLRGDAVASRTSSRWAESTYSTSTPAPRLLVSAGR